ncbi:MAG TPA: glycosyltransferase [Tepidisphaeraceae bacterium]|nr:glycosyltransferase [Tepidisphaeraceae bacterium]
MSSKRPRVLQIITHLALGGAERVAFNLMKGLRDRFDFSLYVANGVDPGPVGQSMQRELQEMSVPLYVGTSVPIKFGGMVLSGLWAARAVRQSQPDLIHLHTEIPESSYASMIAMRPGRARIPLVRTIHNTIYWNPWRKLGRWCDKKMLRSFVASVSQGAQHAFEELRAESGAGALPQPPRIIFNGVLVKNQPREIGRLPGERYRILFAGRFEDQKGVDLLPQIIRSVKPSRPCDLLIHGSGTHEAKLRELAANPPPGWTIQVNGPVPDLASELPQFDLLLMPSRYEGLALVAIEAALLAVPVLATDGPGLREGFPGDYPWLAKAGHADGFSQLLQKAIDDPAAIAASVPAAMEFARANFDVTAMCDSYAALYRQAMAYQ